MDLPEGYQDLFDDASRAFLVLSTVRGSGEPVVAPLWFVTDDEGLLFTTGMTAAKTRDLRARPGVAGIVMAEGEHERYVSVRGRAVELGGPEAVTVDAEAVHRRIVRRYEGHDPAEPLDGTVFRLVPLRVTGYDYRDLPG
ncbi:MAG TPA: pyridoxamine 5'-phosphate oxidase family protein [Actinomycetes bacterium]|nr:pyridoxamine 5'-phosphate oxidase family protein [Actinomycetes bacterium]